MNPRNRHTLKKPEKPSVKLSLSTSRTGSLKLLVFAIGLVLVSRLFYLQIVRHSHYESLALAAHQKKYDIPASRGTLYFRDGDEVVPAVLNSKVFTLYADPTLVKNSGELASYIAASLKLDEQEVKEKLEVEETSYSIIAKRLSKEQVDQLFKQREKLVGVNITAVPQRVYPEGTLGSQALGFVNDEGNGQYGVEEYLNEQLSGTTGQLEAITDVRGVPLTADDKSNIAVAPKNGDDLVLTIDRNVQAKAEEVLAGRLKKVGATKGSVIVIDPNTGAVRAMANRPNFDPAKYYDVGNDAYERFRNRVVSDPYETGSVIKALTMVSGIDAGVVSQDSTFYNAGFVQVDDARIENVLDDVNGTRTMTEVLQYSLNTGVVHVLSQLGGGEINLKARERLYDYFTTKYGFGENTGIEQAGEVPGTIFGPKSEQGNNVRYANMAFGQGMNVSMVQATSAFSAAINGGEYYKPHMVEGVRNEDGSVDNKAPEPVRSSIVSDSASKQIKAMTRKALNETASISNLLKKGYRVGGKTGTSQTIDPLTGKYRDDKTVGSYLGYGGDSQPQYVIMVRVDDAKLSADQYAGSDAAAPIFAELSNWLIDYYNISPM
jgi:cell division protein FtsI (penicillin-binding protein 3)/stage V sporulation protein D (sporulation-specific penicillin-binding protein)